MPHGTRVIALFGPTAVGKTAVAVALAERLRARGEDPVAVSADALQVYAGLETLTGVATPAERARLEHRLVSFVPIAERYSAGAFVRRAHAEIDGLLHEGRRPIVVGGTGLYLRAALTDLQLHPPAPADVRARWTAELERRGAPDLHAELGRRAPQIAARVRPTDPRRITRALELLDIGALDPKGPAPDELWTARTRHPTLLAGLTRARDDLYARIDARVDAMVKAGAVDEVRAADAAGASPNARAALGFAELLTGDVEATKRRTRNYAKRQLTWMRKQPGTTVLDITGRTPEDVAAEIDGLSGR